ncbi:Hsp20/alpha crystallin family protein [Neorhizobium petrolearium]|uniref:Hsp20/alpha crystallin family protein n=1 Tax=Neorhizobium petrolearium TaxID=515361 RepID=A0ABY8LVJ4_9HYPH|nr:Hsp20/alpha crystallin family protein [Neorhizobium petrolearium]MCC2611134.1 Hsp20/alpha crystallin family protein [Neorhizobium petrolearium]WGI66346.1 Hsp20/alpha crystallin family protein [Neorhizobium petrolearium]
MSVRDLIPWDDNGGSRVPSFFRDDDRDPFLSLHREVNRLFDAAFRGFGSGLPAFGRPSAFGGAWASVEISDNDKEIKVSAEVPGLEQKDIEVLLNDGVPTLEGEKRSEVEDKDRQFSERYYGRFERRIPLGSEIKEDKVDARFKNGVLTVTLPKSDKAQSELYECDAHH